MSVQDLSSKRRMVFAKTTRPDVSRAIRRSRLFRRLDASRSYPATWISGPPGIGKTTLVASWLAAKRLRSLWYQIDEGDDDVATLFYYLGLAAPRRRRPLPLFQPEYAPGLSAFSRRFFRELYDRLRPPFVVVFDNYQEAPSKALLHEVMRDALAEIPPGGRVVVLSRADPPPALARLRASRSMRILEGGELRFTLTESRATWHRLAPRARMNGRARAAHEMTEGWAAGLVLLAEHARTRQAPLQAPSTGVSDVLFAYFARELFENMRASARTVLLAAAFVPRLTGPMAVALTRVRTAGSLLATLARQNYFTTRHASGQGIHAEPAYEFHPLFRSFLLAEGTRRLTPARRRRIQRAAARVLEAAGLAEDAAPLLRDAEDWPRLAKLVREHARSLLTQGRGQTLEGWLASLPESVIDADPWLLYWRAAARVAMDHAACRRDCEAAIAAFRARGDAAGAYLAWSTAIFSIVYESVSAYPYDRWSRLFDVLRSEFPTFPSEEIEARVTNAMVLVVTWRQPRHPDAPLWAKRSFELLRRQPDVTERAQALFPWVVHHLERGEFALASSVLPELFELARSRESHPLVGVMALGAITWMWVAGEAASRRAASEGLRLALTSGIPNADHELLLECAGIALNDGELATATELLRTMAKDLGKAPPAYVLKYHRYAVWEALLRKDLVRAASHARSTLQTCDTGRPSDEAFGRLLAAHALHECGDRDEARRQLARVRVLADEMQSPFVEFMGRLAETHVALDDGRDDEALASLDRAMTLGRRGGYSTTYGWRPDVMARLCARALEAGIEVEYVGDLIRKRNLVADPPPVDVEAWPWPVRVYTLGRFEVVRDDRILTSSRKVQRRPLALLKALIAFGGESVREEPLLDALWPDAEGDAAQRALAAALHRLRRLLGRSDAVTRQGARVRLDPRVVWTDTRAMERLLERASAAATAGRSEDAAALTARADALHAGPFLADEPDSPWAAPLRDRLERRLARAHSQAPSARHPMGGRPTG